MDQFPTHAAQKVMYHVQSVDNKRDVNVDPIDVGADVVHNNIMRPVQLSMYIAIYTSFIMP